MSCTVYPGRVVLRTSISGPIDLFRGFPDDTEPQVGDGKEGGTGESEEVSRFVNQGD